MKGENMQSDVSEINEFLYWLEKHKDMPREDMRMHLMYSWFRPRALRAVGYFRRDHDRYLRREVVDKFLSGDEVDMGELREGVLGLCLAISGMGDAVHRAQKQQHKDRCPPRPRRERLPIRSSR